MMVMVLNDHCVGFSLLVASSISPLCVLVLEYKVVMREVVDSAAALTVVISSYAMGSLRQRVPAVKATANRAGGKRGGLRAGSKDD
jgi:hypothetical protein